MNNTNGAFRILHFVSRLSINTGVMSFILNYYRHIDRNVVQFDFLYFLDCDEILKEEIEVMGGRVYHIQKPDFGRESRKNAETFFEEHASDYIALHNHEAFLTFYIAPLAKKYGIRNIITHSHSTRYSDKKINAIRNRILCIPVKRLSDFYFACSKAAGTFLFGNKLYMKQSIHLIANAIESEKYRFDINERVKMRQALGISNQFVIGNVGRFFEQKNHSFLIDVFNEIVKLESNSVLMLVGDGRLKSALVNKVSSLGLTDKVLFLGTRNDVPNLLQAMDVFVLTSIFEGLGIVNIEAQASGLPCYVSNVVPAEACLSNMFNRLSLKKSARYWAEKILEEWGRYNDGNLTYRACGEQAVISHGFDVNIEAVKLEQLYSFIACRR